MQVSNYFAPTDQVKQEGYNAYLTDKNAERLASALCRMRGAALKLGQMLSIQDEGVLPPQVSPNNPRPPAALTRISCQAWTDPSHFLSLNRI